MRLKDYFRDTQGREPTNFWGATVERVRNATKRSRQELKKIIESVASAEMPDSISSDEEEDTDEIEY